MNPVDRILNLINNKKITERKFLLDLNFGLGTLSEWKSEKSKSYKMHADKIADYFNVSTDYILCRTDDQTPPSEKSDAPMTPSEKKLSPRALLRQFSMINPKFTSGRDIDDFSDEEVLELIEILKEVEVERAKRKENK